MSIHDEETLRNDSPLIEDEGDIIITLTNHLESEAKRQGSKITLHYEATDKNLHLKSGSTAQYIEQVAENNRYEVIQKGASMIMLTKSRNRTPVLRKRGFVNNW